ncbi:MAG: helix-turn-helix domain-containing protein [Candidatus Competibacteraceae bacterium]|nr:helix-turn-helix domain-containing protein [Candidatus Competibacteraceae bacterium]
MHEIKPTGIYSADEIAEIFETTKRYVWSVLSSGDLTGRKVSKRWYSTGAALLAFLENPPLPSSPAIRSPGLERAAGTSQTTTITAADEASAPVDAVGLTAVTKQHLFSIQSALEKTSARQQTERTDSNNADRDRLADSPTPPPASPIELQIEREAALSKAWQDAGGSVQNTVKLMNQRMQNGGPAPEQAGKWTQSSVRKIAQHLGLNRNNLARYSP